MADELICEVEKRFASGFSVSVHLRLPLITPQVTVLFGPSGSGKSTVLRMLAGLETPDHGLIRYKCEVWYESRRRISLPPQKRSIGFLFQDYALFPHLTVSKNIELALRGAAEKRSRLQQVLNTFELADLSDYYPRKLSGGQQQRVALARALAPQPGLLLLDEPLSALDSPARMRLRYELRQLLVKAGIPAILVTHDRAEAIALSDRLAVITEGRIRQMGPVEEVFSRPADLAVAQSVGIETIIPARVIGWEGGLLILQAGQMRIRAVDPGDLPDQGVFACIRGEEVTLSRELAPHTSARNQFQGTIQQMLVEGPLVRVTVDCGFPIVALVTKQAAGELALHTGDQVTAAVKAVSVHLIGNSRC